MKKLGLFLLFASSLIQAQTTLEKCGAGSCYGFGPPTGQAANGYIYQDVSQSIPALFCAKNGTWMSCGGTSTGGSVIPSPQFRMGYFPTVGTSNNVQGDAGSTTDGNGNVTHSSVTTINQNVTGFFDHSNLDQSPFTNGNFLGAAHRITSNSSIPNEPFGSGASAGLWVLSNSWGVGKSVGNPAGFTSAAGWRVQLGENITLFGGSSGIHQGLHIDPFVHAAGDSAAIYEGNGGGFSPCMWTAAGDEGCVGININGTQQDCIATGTISSTTGTGDTAPVFNIAGTNCNGAAQLINDGIIIDTSITKLHTNLTGTVSTVWETNPFQMGSLAVTPGTAVLSTGIGVTTADIPMSTVPGTYQTQSFTSTVHDSLPLAVGAVFVATAGGPEQCNILTVSGSGTQTGTISCAKFHPAGSYIFQGGTQGFGDFDDDLAQATFQHSVVYVLGATDTSHLIIAHRQVGSFRGDTLPYRGIQPAGLTLTGGFTVHPGALCVSTNSTNTACTLEFNTVAWANGHGFASPTGIPSLEELASLTSSQTSPDSPFSPGDGISINFRNTTQHSAKHPFIKLSNQAALSKYANSGTGTGWLNAPPAIDVQGAMGNLLQFDMMIPDATFGSANCNGPQAAVICYKNAPVAAPNFNLFTDARGSEKIFLDGANSRFRFLSWGISAPAAEITTTGGGTAAIASNATNATVTLTATALGVANVGYVAPGLNAFFLAGWSSGNPSGLTGALGLFDGTTNVFPWSTNATDDLFFNTPLSGGNVAAGTGATAKLDHLGSLTVANFASPMNVKPVGASSNGTINFGANFGNAAIYLFDGGAGARVGWGLQPSEMQFFTGTTGGNHYSWNKGGDLQTSGTNEVMRLLTGTGDLLIGTTTDDGVNKLQVNGGIKAGGPITAGGTGSSVSTGTASNTDLAGQVTLVAGSGTQALTGTYTSAPIVVCSDTTAVAAVKCVASTTTITITGTGTDVINYITIGRN